MIRFATLIPRLEGKKESISFLLDDVSLWSLGDLDGKTYVSGTGYWLVFNQLTKLLKGPLLTFVI